LFCSSSRPDFDVKSSDADFFASNSDVLGGLHGGVWRVFISIRFDFHTTGNSGDGFFSRQIGDVNEGIIVRSVQVANAKHVFAIGDLWTESDDFFFLGDLPLWGHVCFRMI
jgi:hypothetical protein